MLVMVLYGIFHKMYMRGLLGNANSQGNRLILESKNLVYEFGLNGEWEKCHINFFLGRSGSGKEAE